MKGLVKIYMRDLARNAFLQLTKAVYYLVRPALFRMPAQVTHEHTLELLAMLDDSPALLRLIEAIHNFAFIKKPVSVGNVELDAPFILSAGFIKGVGFETQEQAIQAVQNGVNVIQGWRTIPRLVGTVEFGSYTRYPRKGNDGEVIWRDQKSYSTQNRVGLKNPGAVAAAIFLAKHKADLPKTFGINIAVSPSVDNDEQEIREVIESIEAFTSRGIYPTWFTLNISCPNTEDDPENNQTETKARELSNAVVTFLGEHTAPNQRVIPLWVKISPELADSQYVALIRSFEDVGVRAIIATNTMPRIAPSDPTLKAGVGGGRLHEKAIKAIQVLASEKEKHQYQIELIGSGGVQDPQSVYHFQKHGVEVMQYWSGMIFRGPFVSAYLLNEM